MARVWLKMEQLAKIYLQTLDGMCAALKLFDAAE
jgi:hypothetical protein